MKRSELLVHVLQGHSERLQIKQVFVTALQTNTILYSISLPRQWYDLPPTNEDWK